MKRNFVGSMYVRLGENPAVEFIRFRKYTNEDGDVAFRHAKTNRWLPINSEGVTNIIHYITRQTSLLSGGDLILHPSGNGMLFYHAKLNGDEYNTIFPGDEPLPEGWV
jgi:hypothetical protein